MIDKLPPDPDHQNDKRAEYAGAALRHYQQLTGSYYDEASSNLICDLIHWCDRHYLDSRDVLRDAFMYYEIETSDGTVTGTNLKLLSAAQAALDYLTDHAIDLDGEPEEILASIRFDLDAAITRAKGGRS